MKNMTFKNHNLSDSLIKRMDGQIQEMFQEYLEQILPIRTIFFSERNGIVNTSKYDQGWDACLAEIIRRLNELK